MSECEERLDVLLLGPAVAYENAFAVMSFGRSRVVGSQSMGSVVLKPYRECHRKFSGRIHVAENDIRQGGSGL